MAAQRRLEAPLPAANIVHAAVRKCQIECCDLNLELLMYMLHSTA